VSVQIRPGIRLKKKRSRRLPWKQEKAKRRQKGVGGLTSEKWGADKKGEEPERLEKVAGREKKKHEGVKRPFFGLGSGSGEESKMS